MKILGDNGPAGNFLAFAFRMQKLFPMWCKNSELTILHEFDKLKYGEINDCARLRYFMATLSSETLSDSPTISLSVHNIPDIIIKTKLKELECAEIDKQSQNTLLIVHDECFSAQ